MILDSKKQQQLLLSILSEHPFTIPGKQLATVTSEIHTLAEAIINARIQEKENGPTPTQDIAQQTDEEEETQENA